MYFSRDLRAMCPKGNFTSVAGLNRRDEPTCTGEAAILDGREFGAHRNRLGVFHVAKAPG